MYNPDSNRSPDNSLTTDERHSTGTSLRKRLKSRSAAALAAFVLLGAAPAGATLTVGPVTWNVIGLDSNVPTAGPKNFPVGVRICSNVATTNVSAVWSWDSANPNIDLRPGSLSTITIPSIAAGACADAYFEVEVSQVPAAYDTTRRFHVTASDSSGPVSSPTPRELYVEHLISQNRNSTTGVKLNGVSIPAGGTMNLVVGTTYTIELDGATATQGYEQLEEFISFPNTIFQILSVSTTYSANTSPYVPNPNDRLYADGCLWENDPNSPAYRSCTGVDGKAGGTVMTTYSVRIIGGGGTSQTLNSLIYDFSGSSFHYNSDFSTGARIASIIDPSLVTVSKTFAPNPTNVGGVSTLTFTLTNPNGGTVTGLNFTDVFPTSPGAMVVATPPAAAATGCGSPTFAPVGGSGSIAFSNGTVAPSGSCTVRVNVTVPAAGSYANTSGHLFIDTLDTGSSASDTLTVNPGPAPPPPVCGLTMAHWSIPNGTTANPPDLSGGVPTTKAANVATATLAANLPASTAILTTTGHGDTTSWSTFGYKNAGQFVQFTLDTSKYSGVQMSFWVANPSPANGPNQITLTVNAGSGFGAPLLTINSPASAFTNHTVDLTGLTSTTGNTLIRLTATGAANENSGASLVYDDILFSGCGTPLPATLTKAFAPNPVAVGATSVLTFTVTNPNPSVAFTGVSFTDTLPPGLTAPAGSTAVCGGTLSIAGNVLTFSGGTLAAGGSCGIPVTVTATTAGPHANVSGFVSSTEGGTNTGATGTASANLTAVLPPVISKQFAPDPILAGGVSTLTLLIANPNPNDTIASVAFSDTFPTSPGAMVVAGTPGASTSGCGTPAFAPAAGAGSISFTGGSIAGGATCTVSVNVTAPAAGTYNNTSGNVSHVINGSPVNGNAASGSLTVNPPHPAIGALKQIGPSSNPAGTWSSFEAVSAGSNVFYKITVENDGDVALSGVGVADPTVNLSSCVWPDPLPVAVAANDNHIATCIVGPVAAASGLHPNTITASGTGGGTPVTRQSSASYATTALSFAKSVAESAFLAAGDTLHYSYLVTNTGFAPLQGPVTVSDTKATVTCPAVTTVGDADDFLDPGEALTCTATYTVTPADVSAKFVTNTAFATISGVNSPTDSRTVPLLAAPTITKSFAAATVVVGGSVNMSFLVANPGGAGLSGLAFGDNLPSGLTAPDSSAGACGGTVSVSSNVVSLSGGSLAAGASCTITLSVTGATAGVKNNTTGPIRSNETGSGATSNTATVTVVGPPTIAKSFGAASIALGGTTSLNLTLANPNTTVALSGISFADSLPGGLSAPAGTSAACGGTLVTGAGALNFTGGALAAGGNCVISVTVTGTAAGVQNNTTGPIGSTEGGMGTTSNTASVTVTVAGAPTITKSFAGPTVPLGGTVGMSFLLANPGGTALTGIAFSDTLPAGLTAAVGSTAVCGGTLAIGGAGTSLSFGGGSLAAGGNCTIAVTVTGATAGVKNNTTGPISSTESGAGAASNTATVTVVAPPTIAKAFGAATIAVGGTTTLTFTLTNPNTTVGLSGVSFADTLPAGLTGPAGTTLVCGGSLAVSGGGVSLAFSGGTLAGGGSCSISVNVTGTTAGVKNNTTGPVSSTESGAGSPSNTATVTVVAPPTIAKSFGAASIPVNGTTSLAFTLANPNGSVALTGVSFTDTLPAGLTAPGGTTPGCGGSLAGGGGGTSLAFSGGTLAGGGSCSISVNVTGTPAGVKNNTTGPVSSTESGAGSPSNTATVTVVAPPTVAKSFGAASIVVNATTSLDFTLANPNATVPLTGVSFTDNLPAGLTAPAGTTPVCGGSFTVAGASLTLSGGMLAAGGSCTVTVTVTGTSTGVKNNTTGPVSSTESGAGSASNTATVTVTAPGAPTITKSFASPMVALGGTVSVSFVLNNPGTSGLTGLAFTDTLPAGLAAPNGTTPVCGGSLVVSGGASLSFSGGALSAGTTCTISVIVTASAAGVQNNTTGPISSNETGVGTPSNTATVTVVAPPTIAKSFGTSPIAVGGTTSLALTLTNPNASVALGGVGFSDPLPSGLSAVDGTSAACGGTLTISGGNLLTFSGGALAAGTTCTITVTVTGASAGTQNNTTSPVTASGPMPLSGSGSNTATLTVGAAAVDIPTLDPRMLLVLAALLALVGARFARR